MRTHLRRSIACGVSAATVILAAAAAHSSVVTTRLATGQFRSGDGLPESPDAEKPETASSWGGIELVELPDGTAILEFDLSSLPAAAKIHRARLFCQREPIDGRHREARTDVRICPVTAPYERGSIPKVETAPLELVGPWYRSFEMTALVQEWLAGKRPAHAVHVKSFPGWQKERTYLDVMYEGEAADVPPQVTGLKATHHAGQTFITWREINDPVGRDVVSWRELKSIREALDRDREVRYCIYRGDRPISAATLAGATLVAQVEPLSCWNVCGRNVERPIDAVIANEPVLNSGQGNPFSNADTEGPYGLDCPIDRFVIPGSDAPLPRGTGLYVHTRGQSGKVGNAFYAVVTSIDGVQNTADFSAANALTTPVAETAGDGEPIFQGTLPESRFWNYPQQRLHYVRWVAPPFGNLPSQYFNWSVGVPDSTNKGISPIYPRPGTDGRLVAGRPGKLDPSPFSLELNLHRDNGSYWRTPYRLQRGSIVLCPHDFPLRTWWYGYHESHGTLKSFAQGRIHNYTERRLISFIDWAARKWPVDPARISVTGVQHSGSAAALRLGLRHPQVFNSIVAGRAVPNMAYFLTDLNTGRNEGRFDVLEGLWGKIDWGSETDAGKNVWEALDMNRLLADMPAATALPLVAMTSSHGWQPANEFYRLMLEKGQPVYASFLWGGETLLPVSADSTWPNAILLDVRRDRVLPAFRGESAVPVLESGKQGEFNLGFRFRSDDIVDRPDRLEITLVWVQLYGNRGQPIADVTLRRLQRFVVQPGKTYHWKSTPLGDPGELPQTGYWRTNSPTEASGEVTVGADGMLTIPGVAFSPLGSRLEVTAK